MKARSDQGRAWLEMEALSLAGGHPEVLDVFLRLTNEGALHLQTDPRGEHLKWDTWNPPAEADLVVDAAVRFLMEYGYVENVARQGSSDYLVRVSQVARDVRAIYDQILEQTESAPSESPSTAP